MRKFIPDVTMINHRPGTRYVTPEQEGLYYAELHAQSCADKTDNKGCFSFTQTENFGVCADLAALGEEYTVRSIRYEYNSEDRRWLVYASPDRERHPLPRQTEETPLYEHESKIKALVHAGRLSEQYFAPVSRVVE
tara:strand:+ start:549 stop:956 length:408 start_codon:yes stop_codon:yes gene_type:complete